MDSGDDAVPNLSNDEADANLSPLISRWRGLGKFDMWWPCILDSGVWEKGIVRVDQEDWHVYGLHHGMQLFLDDSRPLFAKTAYGLVQEGAGGAYSKPKFIFNGMYKSGRGATSQV